MIKLLRREVEKPWGRNGIGEIWFEAPEGRPLPLLIKYIFTSEALSVQVHPNDEQARARGLPNGKTECWYILNAEPGAALALGFRERIGAEAMRAAALDGSIERLIDWKPVAAGDFFYVPAGTVHAIGAGISLIEVQQPSDVTYRLYDYGRPRELHLDDAISVARGEAYPETLRKHVATEGTMTLVEGPPFTLLHVAGGGDRDALIDRDRSVLPLDGTEAGECLFVPAGRSLDLSAEVRFLLAAEG